MDQLNEYNDSEPEIEANPLPTIEVNITPVEILIGDRAAQIEKNLNWDDFNSVISSLKTKAFYIKTMHDFFDALVR